MSFGFPALFNIAGELGMRRVKCWARLDKLFLSKEFP